MSAHVRASLCLIDCDAVLSRMIMSWALSMMARAKPARLVGLAASIRASRYAKKTTCLHGDLDPGRSAARGSLRNRRNTSGG